MFLAGLVLAVVLYVVGSAMDRHERAERERRWRR